MTSELAMSQEPSPPPERLVLNAIENTSHGDQVQPVNSLRCETSTQEQRASPRAAVRRSQSVSPSPGPLKDAQLETFVANDVFRAGLRHERLLEEILPGQFYGQITFHGSSHEANPQASTSAKRKRGGSAGGSSVQRNIRRNTGK